MTSDWMLQSSGATIDGAEPNSSQASADTTGKMQERRRYDRRRGAGMAQPAMPPDGEPDPIRRRATDDPATPIPKRNVSGIAKSLAEAAGTGIRYSRRATDPCPEPEELPDVDCATPELRRRIAAAQAEAQAKSRRRRWWLVSAAAWRSMLR